VFKVSKAQRRAVTIDLASVRDTLLYIESDLHQSPRLDRLAAAIRSALVEIERLEPDGKIERPEITAARFLPVQFDN
jgi:hypothetical protein